MYALEGADGAAGGEAGGATGFWICPSPICWTGTTVGMEAMLSMAAAPTARPKRIVEARILECERCLGKG